MLHHTQKALTQAAAELLGDLRPLLEQIGSPGGAGTVGTLPAREINDLQELRVCLQTYHSRVLRPLELPAIQRAFYHGSHNELRELIALDQELSRERLLQNFAPASRHVGHNQLQRLRPLRDERLVQRYLDAIDRGEAHGWHTLVYGLTLAVYSLPLRQGLLGYAQQTTRGFIQSAAATLTFSKTDGEMLFEDLCAGLPAEVESLLTRTVIA